MTTGRINQVSTVRYQKTSVIDAYVQSLISSSPQNKGCLNVRTVSNSRENRLNEHLSESNLVRLVPTEHEENLNSIEHLVLCMALNQLQRINYPLTSHRLSIKSNMRKTPICLMFIGGNLKHGFLNTVSQ